jgi:hypothetical protein
MQFAEHIEVTLKGLVASQWENSAKGIERRVKYSYRAPCKQIHSLSKFIPSNSRNKICPAPMAEIY